jgi:hypothetical protein
LDIAAIRYCRAQLPSLPRQAVLGRRLSDSVRLENDGDRAMNESNYDETRAVARLPNLDIEILYRRPSEGDEEQMLITLRAVPSFEAFGRFVELANPLLFWMRLMPTPWIPWLNGLAEATLTRRVTGDQ